MAFDGVVIANIVYDMNLPAYRRTHLQNLSAGSGRTASCCKK